LRILRTAHTYLYIAIGLVCLVGAAAHAQPAVYPFGTAAESKPGELNGSAYTDFIWPTNGWEVVYPDELGMDASKLLQARDYALSGGGSGLITRSGKAVMVWGDIKQLYDVKSTTKSIGGSSLGLALQDGLVNLSDSASSHLPAFGTPPETNLTTGWLDDITILHLATMTAGFDKPGGYGDLLFAPGSAWAYSDGGANWLADVLTVRHNQDLNELLFLRIFDFLGIGRPELVWRNNASREDTINGIKRRELNSGIETNVDAMARIGYLYLRNGQWETDQLLPQNFIQLVSSNTSIPPGIPVVNDPLQRFGGASGHYGVLWWNNADGSIPGVPLDAYWSWGLYDSLIIVIPSLDIVVSRAGSEWPGNRSPSYYQILQPFMEPVVQSVAVYTCPEAVISYWKLDETASSVFVDTFGGHHGLCSGSGCPTPVAGMINGGQQFGGGSGFDIPVNTAFDFGAADSFSVEFWLKKEEAPVENEVMVGRHDPASGLTWWFGLEGGTGSPRGYLSDTSGDSEVFSAGTTVTDGYWHHLVFIRDNDVGRNLVYVDGNLEGSVDKISYAAGFGSESAPVTIGRLSAVETNPFNGVADEVVMYHRTLTSAEIAHHFHSGLDARGICESGPYFNTFRLETAVDETADRSEWTAVEGTLEEGFRMDLAPAVDYHYLDVDADPGAIETNRPLAENFYVFFLEQSPAEFLAYWAERGVDENAVAGSWQEHMWKIINHFSPMFYLRVSNDPGEARYKLIDGLQHDYEPIGVEGYLRFNGDYPLGSYAFTGRIMDNSGLESNITIRMTFEKGPVPDIDGDGDVDGRDLSSLIYVFGTSRGDFGYDRRCDFNLDSSVNSDDLAIFSGEFGSDGQ
jgi:CubicO group peptidase (beta-lactamase class C family)